MSKLHLPVVTDASPIISTARAKKLHLLREVYGTLIFPGAVYDEIVIKGMGMAGSQEIKDADWIKVVSPKDCSQVQALKSNFGAGESEAIVVAQEEGAILLADEKAVIIEARKRNIPITSTLLMLLEAKNIGIIKSVRKELDELIISGFRVTEVLYKAALTKAEESVLL